MEPRAPWVVRLARYGRIVRDAWLVLGVVLAIVLVLETGYRAQAALKNLVFRTEWAGFADRPDFPYRHQTWWDDFVRVRREHVLGGNVRYDPYRAWRALPLESPTLRIDSLGLRRTVRLSADRPDSDRAIFMFGGSTMWGYTVRDSATIPSFLAQRLHEDGYTQLDVVNLSQSAYTATQGLITLMLELRAGRIPEAAVFLDGINEIGPVYEGGEPGEIYEQARFADVFERDPLSLPQKLLSVTEHLLFVKRLARLVQATPPSPDGVEPSATQCHEIVTQYMHVVRMVSALGREYGFPVIAIWQPTLALTQKRLTSWERFALSQWPKLRESTRSCSSAVDSTMVAADILTFVNMSAVFDRDTATVFLDNWGHVVESADRKIADAIAEVLRPLIGSPPDSDSRS